MFELSSGLVSARVRAMRGLLPSAPEHCIVTDGSSVNVQMVPSFVDPTVLVPDTTPCPRGHNHGLCTDPLCSHRALFLSRAGQVCPVVLARSVPQKKPTTVLLWASTCEDTPRARQGFSGPDLSCLTLVLPTFPSGTTSEFLGYFGFHTSGEKGRCQHRGARSALGASREGVGVGAEQ